LVRANPRKLRKIKALYAGIDNRLGPFLSETPEAELQTVAKFFSSMNALRTEHPSE